MNTATYRPPIEGAIIESVVLVDRVTHPGVRPFRSASLPGHLVHIVLAGEVEQEVSGRIQRLTPGTGVWYCENEPIRGKVLRAPWTFYTVNFLAPRLPPPPFEERTWQATPEAHQAFQSLLDAWNDEPSPHLTRHLRTFSLLMELLLEVFPAAGRHQRADAATHLWWEIEAKLREDLSQPIYLRRLEKLWQRSQRSITRACRLAVGTSPMKRVKELRLSYARGLVLYSHLPMTEIALRVGYTRAQELSRDYHRRFGITPSDDRRAGPDYRKPPRE